MLQRFGTLKPGNMHIYAKNMQIHSLAIAKNPNKLQMSVHKVNKLTYKYWMAIPMPES
jgi:hypothetical protein